MANLPGSTPNPVDGLFILVKDSQGQNRLAVRSVAPNATVTFLDASAYYPCFKDGNTPFNSNTTTIANDAQGSYPFNMVLKAPNGPPTSFPYAIHVTPNGTSQATLRVVGETLRVVVTARRQPNGSLNIEFYKEGFNTTVSLTYTEGGNLINRTIPNLQIKGFWSGAGLSANTVTFTLDNMPETYNGVPTYQVVGGEEGDLDILPPE